MCSQILHGQKPYGASLSLLLRLKQLTKRQVDLNFEQLVQRYQAKQKQQEDLAFKAKFEEEERMRKYLQGQRRQGLDKSKQAKQKQLEMMGKIRDATVRIPKPPDSKVKFTELL
ncbi:hypothetical protein pdam_00013259 [Pocillopora damicornis]|uniref:Uncharacterized protein n=1 Tax=Pocillopora damicornis TaxID=46731 RepID=A0A3M6TJ05_POCDA|nr:hypothetical protein pdam_00013259 [Pocillopora damicornis]